MKEEKQSYGNNPQTTESGGIDLTVSHNLSGGKVGHGRSDNHQRGRNSDISHQSNRFGYHLGCVKTYCYNDGCDDGTQKGRTQEYLGIECLDGVFALDKHDTNGEDKEGVGHVEKCCIEDCLMTEDAGYNGVAEETYIAEHRCKTNNSLFVMIFADELR